LNVSLVRSGRDGFAPLGLCFARTDGERGRYRMLLWGRPGDGRVGLFVPRGVDGRLPDRVCVTDGADRRLGSGKFVGGLRAVMLRLEALPLENSAGELWLQVSAVPGCGWREVMARSRG